MSIKIATHKLKLVVLHYVYGMFAQSWNGSISALDAYIGLAVGATVDPQVHSISLRAAVFIFGVTFVRQTIGYFKQKPLPTDISDIVSELPKQQ